MKISQLQALVAVADHRNFTEAAFSLSISQSAVSHAIASLEEELGIPLLSRGRHGARLTSAGERVIPYARQMLELQDQILRQANLEKGFMGGQIRLAAFRSAATHVLPQAIARFRDRFPEVTVTVTEDDYPGVEQALREGSADIGLLTLPSSEEFDAWQITQDEYVVLLPSSQAPRHKILTWDELASHAFILSNCPGMTNLLDYFAAAQVELNVAYRVREDSTVVGMVAQGLGAGILPSLAADPLPRGVHLYSLPLPLPRVIGAAVLASALHGPAVFAFLDALRGTGLFTAREAV